MMKYSTIPIVLTPQNGGKMGKIPNTKLLIEATGDSKWGEFQKRLPTAAERAIFDKSEYQAIVTGEISGLTVVDLDGTAEKWLTETMRFNMPKTPTVRTQSGGKHLYFKYDSRMKTGTDINGEQENGRGIDVRNDGGYAVAFGPKYEWIHSLEDTELQEVPALFLMMQQMQQGKKPAKAITKAPEPPKSQPKHKVIDGERTGYDRARRANMISFLASKGYNVQEGHAFSCIFPDHEDNNPSAGIMTKSNGEHRYICHSHPGGKLNLSTIDIWTELQGIEPAQAVKEILAFEGIDYIETEFHKEQKEKYHYNTTIVNDLQYIADNFPHLYKYLNRYELELRALMDYAETNIKGRDYKHKNQSIFFISKNYAGELFRSAKNNATVNSRRSHTFMSILCLLGILERVPEDKLSDYAKDNAIAAKKHPDHKIANFYLFNRMSDKVLSHADNRAEVMRANRFKVSTMCKDTLIDIFGLEVANSVFPDARQQSKQYQYYLNTYATIIFRELNGKGYTTKKEVVSKLRTSTNRRTREYHFDKVINEICSLYDLDYSIANKEKKQRLNVKENTRMNLIYKNADMRETTLKKT